MGTPLLLSQIRRQPSHFRRVRGVRDPPLTCHFIVINFYCYYFFARLFDHDNLIDLKTLDDPEKSEKNQIDCSQCRKPKVHQPRL